MGEPARRVPGADPLPPETTTTPVQVHRIPFNEVVGAYGHYLAGGTHWSAVWDTATDAVLLYRPQEQEQTQVQVPAVRRKAA